MNRTLPFYPACPRPAGISILELSQDDFCLERKADGAHVLVLDGIVYSRHGTVLSKPKGHDRVLAACSTLPAGICLEGEWEGACLWCFDLPLHGGIHDERIEELTRLISHLGPKPGVNVGLIHRAVDCSFREFYETWKRGRAEGVVAKRRNARWERCDRPGIDSRYQFKRRFARDRVGVGL